jgi:hypothetical protein
VVDYKLFTPQKPLLPGTFWVLEQIPDYIHAYFSLSLLSLFSLSFIL